jgi:hypothetical protein
MFRINKHYSAKSLILPEKKFDEIGFGWSLSKNFLKTPTNEPKKNALAYFLKTDYLIQ